MNLDELKQGVKDHPYMAFGLVMIPVVYGVTGEWWMALFTGAILMFGPEIAEGFSDVDDGEDDDPDSVLEGLDPWDKG